MSISTYGEQLTACDLQIKSIIQDINRDEITSQELDDLNLQARLQFKLYRSILQKLQVAGEEQENIDDSQRAAKQHNEFQDLLSSTLTSMRRSHSSALRRIERDEKNELMMSAETDATQLTHRSSKGQVARAAGEVTASLRNVAQQLHEQVTASENTLSTLAKSSEVVRKTRDEFNEMAGHIQNSGRLLKKYSRREQTDRVLIFLALVFFVCCVLYIVKSRMF